MIRFQETASDYQRYIAPNIPTDDFHHWKMAKSSPPLFHNEAFFLIKDIKWRDKKINNLHLLAICRLSELHSIRDLNGERHLSLLKKIRKQVLEYIAKEYKLSENKINIYFHYYPTIWQLHLHFSHVDKSDRKKNELHIGSTHYLEDVIENLEQHPDYYQKRTLPIFISQERLQHLFSKKKFIE